ncbi:ArsR/SmtB family transcription factor [Bosea sp. 2RAB26]|uniref:ArsR/SmtB family transcription factor n=1 Tax=Bosea sp. 2RAB26 TaxID=3237476 RepID=UPI003F8E10BF
MDIANFLIARPSGAMPDDRATSLPEPAATLEARALQASELFKVLAHKNRLKLLYLLAEQERSVAELETALSLSQAMVSQQLTRLRLQRIVSTRRVGRRIFYRLNDRGVGAVIAATLDATAAHWTKAHA